MIAHHRFTITATCPVDGSQDTYDATVTVTRVLPVELIAPAVERSTSGGPAFQEQIAQRLADDLRATVELVGTHSGITSTVTATPCATTPTQARS